MSKIRATIISGVFVLIATVAMGLMYTISAQSYSYVNNLTIDELKVNNINIINGIDTTRVDGPNIINNDVELELDLLPYETYSFTYDIVNDTAIDYKLNSFILNGNLEDINDYLTITLFFDNGKQVKNNSAIPKGTKRIVYATISYNKNVSDMKTFKLRFNQEFKPGV